MDVSDTIVAKSDQLNADDLLGGPITVEVIGVSRSDAKDQPLLVKIGGGHMPFKPCKTMRRVLVAAWGKDASQWRGRMLRLFRDDRVKWGGAAVGGVRISHMTHIAKDGLTLSLTETKGKKAAYTVEFLADQRPSGKATADLDGFLAENGLARADIDRWRKSEDKPLLDDLNADQVAQIAGWLAGDPKRLDPIRALIPKE